MWSREAQKRACRGPGLRGGLLRPRAEGRARRVRRAGPASAGPAAQRQRGGSGSLVHVGAAPRSVALFLALDCTGQRVLGVEPKFPREFHFAQEVVFLP